MDNNKSNGGAFVAIFMTIAIAIAGIAIFSSVSNTKATTTATKPKTSSGTYSAPVQKETPKTTPKVETKQETAVTWHCVDATSYNKNPYDDNKCTSSTGEVRYVSDSESRLLDPSYTPGTSGNAYYNRF